MQTLRGIQFSGARVSQAVPAPNTSAPVPQPKAVNPQAARDKLLAEISSRDIFSVDCLAKQNGLLDESESARGILSKLIRLKTNPRELRSPGAKAELMDGIDMNTLYMVYKNAYKGLFGAASDLVANVFEQIYDLKMSYRGVALPQRKHLGPNPGQGGNETGA